MRLYAFAVAIALWGCAFASDVTCAGPMAERSSVDEDAFLNMTQLVTKYGYPVEKHTVQTKDGYLLSVYRIPYGRQCGPGNGTKTPVLLQHGLLSSSFDFLILGPSKSLGYRLADKCYDVWLGNNRGNGEGKAHIALTPKQKEFWNFSWHEMGIYDLPATIDYILQTTGRPQLHYMGHSQGTTQFFVFASLKPEYHHKIRTMHALSPVALMGHVSSPIVKLLTKIRNLLEFLAKMSGMYELFPSQTLLNLLGSEMCKDKYPGFQVICCNVMFLLCGFDEHQMNKTMLPAIVGHTPAGTGIGPVIHYAQEIQSKKFRQYDYGEKMNKKIYNSKTPPEYPVHKINVPTALYYGPNDFLAHLDDVQQFAKKLPNVIEKYKVPFWAFNHLDFLFAADINCLLHDRVIEVLEKYN